MKRFLIGFSVIGFFWSCTPDDSGSIFDPSDISFVFEVSGVLNKTMSGQGIFYNETTTQGVDSEGEEIDITTLLIVAQADDSDDQVIFAVTTQGSEVNTGNYGVGSDIFTAYNVFMNFSGDRGETIAYQSQSGTITIDAKGIFAVKGSVDVACSGIGGGGDIAIRGTFAAESVN